ncbi:MAG: endonuclease/exonuclease/phosphatase family protein [Desulfobulbaceae bacterium]|uniref:Endonuclease/exonuclease/phosphatase family protein n=1 Tax=Candidatus Desulfatifera sulfidica TaxID=2841691 RepID=A0A8J6N9U5_9BACT|nr:endonuclease/exonuclease/phosphatase family protein [Candidatus Desulfatifera sulfidica]
MKFLLYNIRYGTGRGTYYHLPLPYAGFFKTTANKMDEISTFIRSVDPDIVALVEVDSGSYRCGWSCQADRLAQDLGYSHVVESKYRNGSLAQRVPVLNKQSNALLCREAILAHRFHYFDEGVKRLVIEVELADALIFIVHLSLKYRHRHQQLEHLHRLLMDRTKPVIVAGDFNTFGGNRELDLFLAATGLCDANAEARPSYPSHAPHRQLDFILHSPELEAVKCQVPDIRLSDHVPMIVEFRSTVDIFAQ